MVADVTTEPVRVWVPVADETVGLVTDRPGTALENVMELMAPPPMVNVPGPGAVTGLLAMVNP